MEESKNKENVQQAVSVPTVTTPTRQNPNTLNSPAQTKGLWDSSDPMRNPPPLPLSPQMLRTTNGKPKGATPPSPVGKLQFTAVDTSEIEYQLQRVIEAQNGLKSLLQGIDTSVKNTQMDLDNLQQRSANNNTHLKDLLENVSTAAVSKSQTVTSLTVEDLQSVIEKSQVMLLSKIDVIETLRNELNDGLAGIVNASSAQKDTLLLQEIAEIKEQMYKIPTDTHGEHIQAISKSAAVYGEGHAEMKEIVSTTQRHLSESLTSLQQTVTGLDIEKHVSSLKESQVSLEAQVKDQVELVNNKSKQSSDEFAKTHESLSAIAEEVKSFKDESLKSIQGLVNRPDISEKIIELEEHIRHIIASEQGKLEDNFNQRLLEIGDSQKNTFEKSTATLESQSLMIEKIDPQLQELLNSIKNLHENISSQRESTITMELEKKNVELSIKDKEIADLKTRLEEEQLKTSIATTIVGLTEQKARLETSVEGLEKVYKLRYDDLRSLSKEHDELHAKWLEFNTEKLKSITGAAAFTQMALEESRLESPSYKKSSALGSRVLSTNSYLTNRRSTLSPKPRKTYELAPIEGEEEKENY